VITDEDAIFKHNMSCIFEQGSLDSVRSITSVTYMRIRSKCGSTFCVHRSSTDYLKAQDRTSPEFQNVMEYCKKLIKSERNRDSLRYIIPSESKNDTTPGA
jgi:hypothetical protein